MDKAVYLGSRAVMGKVFVACALGCLFGCGPKNGAAENTTSAEAIKTPATVEQAAQILDLSTFPLMDGATPPGSRQVANLSYVSTVDVKTGFEFHRKALVGQDWKELPNTSVTEKSASAMFSRSGFVVSLSVYPNGQTGGVSVSLQNRGNVKPGQLPVPPGAKSLNVRDSSTAYVTEAAVPATAAACRNLFPRARLGALRRRRGYRHLQTERNPRHRDCLVRTRANREDHDPLFEPANFG